MPDIVWNTFIVLLHTNNVFAVYSRRGSKQKRKKKKKKKDGEKERERARRKTKTKKRISRNRNDKGAVARVLFILNLRTNRG